MKGATFAFLAAICNSCIGIFNSFLINDGLSSTEIAFWRCFIAFLLTAFLCVSHRGTRKNLKQPTIKILKYALLSLFGIYIMYLFETSAVKLIPISLVSFLLYASGILTILLSCALLNEKITLKKLISIVIVLIGIVVMFISNLKFNGNIIGLLFAIIAGTGYSLYIFLNKKWKISSNIVTLFYIFAFGSIFLGIQLLIYNNSLKINYSNIIYILLLSIVPTMGGFYFTNKALCHSTAGEVQLIEMSEPFISTLLGFLILNQTITNFELVGGIIIISGLLLFEKSGLHKTRSKCTNRQ